MRLAHELVPGCFPSSAMPGADLSAAPSWLRCPHFVLDIFPFMLDGDATGSFLDTRNCPPHCVQEARRVLRPLNCHRARDMLEKFEGDSRVRTVWALDW